MTRSSFSVEDMISLELQLGIPMPAVRTEIDLVEESQYRKLSPGLNDIQLGRITRLGHKGKLPLYWNWENILSSMTPGEELLWIVVMDSGEAELYLGLKANTSTIQTLDDVRNRRKRFEVALEGVCRRAFPESKARMLDDFLIDSVLGKIETSSSGKCTMLSGFPSPKALDTKSVNQDRRNIKETYSSLNDILEPFMEENSFAVIFSLTKAPVVKVTNQIRKFNDLRTTISPYIKIQSASSTTKQKGKQTGRSSSSSKGESVQEKRNILKSMWQSITGASKNDKGKKKIARNYTYSSNLSSTTTGTESTSKSTSYTISTSDAGLAMLDKHLENKVQHLIQCQGTGGYQGCVFVCASDQDLRSRISNTIAGVLSGSKTHLNPFRMVDCTGKDGCFDFKYNSPPSSIIDGVVMLNVNQASRLLLLPEAELPGLRLKRNIFYGRALNSDFRQTEREALVRLGVAAFKESSISKHSGLGLDDRDREIVIGSEQMLSHMLITGATGSGKTVRAIKILNDLPTDKNRVFIIETAKKVYRNRFSRGDSEPRVYNLGGFDGEPFRINPFYFDMGTSLKRHISVLCDALNDLLPVEALIGPKLREAVLNCYTSKKWNIETGTYEGREEAIYPTMIDFNMEIVKLCQRLGYSSEINENYRGALLGRARVFIDDLYQDVFSHEGNIPFDEQFGEDTVIELADLPPSEINMPAFIVSLFLQRLRAWHSLHLSNESLFSIVAIEEAHNILSKKLEMKHDKTQTGGGKNLVDQVNRLLQEGRELGIGVVVIDQSPRNLADAVMKNTNTKIVHRLLDSEEAEVIGKGIGLNQEECRDIHYLEDGECVVSLKQGGKPHKIAPYRKDELPDILHRELDKPKAPNYAKCERILQTIPSSSTLSDISDKAFLLQTECNSNLILLDYMFGKHLAWHNLLNGHETLICPSSSLDDVEFKLAQLCLSQLNDKVHMYQLNSDIEFEKLFLCKLFDGSYTNAMLADRLFGKAWIFEAQSRFTEHIKLYANISGVDDSLIEDIECCLYRMAQSYSTPSSEENLIDLRFVLGNSNAMFQVATVIADRFRKRLMFDSGVRENIYTCVMSMEWDKLHSIVLDRLHLLYDKMIDEFVITNVIDNILKFMSEDERLGDLHVKSINGSLLKFREKKLGVKHD